MAKNSTQQADPFTSGPRKDHVSPYGCRAGKVGEQTLTYLRMVHSTAWYIVQQGTWYNMVFKGYNYL